MSYCALYNIPIALSTLSIASKHNATSSISKSGRPVTEKSTHKIDEMGNDMLSRYLIRGGTDLFWTYFFSVSIHVSGNILQAQQLRFFISSKAD